MLPPNPADVSVRRPTPIESSSEPQVEAERAEKVVARLVVADVQPKPRVQDATVVHLPDGEELTAPASRTAMVRATLQSWRSRLGCGTPVSQASPLVDAATELIEAAADLRGAGFDASEAFGQVLASLAGLTEALVDDFPAGALHAARHVDFAHCADSAKLRTALQRIKRARDALRSMIDDISLALVGSGREKMEETLSRALTTIARVIDLDPESQLDRQLGVITHPDLPLEHRLNVLRGIFDRQVNRYDEELLTLVAANYPEQQRDEFSALMRQRHELMAWHDDIILQLVDDDPVAMSTKLGELRAFLAADPSLANQTEHVLAILENPAFAPRDKCQIAKNLLSNLANTTWRGLRDVVMAPHPQSLQQPIRAMQESWERIAALNDDLALLLVEGSDAEIEAAIERIQNELAAMPENQRSHVIDRVLQVLGLEQIPSERRLELARHALLSAAGQIERNIFELITGGPAHATIQYSAAERDVDEVMSRTNDELARDYGVADNRSFTPADRHNLLMLRILTRGGCASDLLYFAARARAHTQLKQELRGEAQTIRAMLADREVLDTEIKARFLLRGCAAKLRTRQELEGYLEAVEEVLTSAGDDSSLALLELQRLLEREKESKLRDSATSKMLHDVAMAVIRNYG